MTLAFGSVEERNLSSTRKNKNTICAKDYDCEKECSSYTERIFSNFNF